MKSPHSFSISGQQLWLSPQKAIFWEEAHTIILSDLHLGKSGHFRKSGIPVPQHVFKDDLHRLFDLVQFFQAENLLIVGDFFHSGQNLEADLFSKWRRDHSRLQIELVVGNHDILPADWYLQNSIALYPGKTRKGPFDFVHEWKEEETEQEQYSFSGHIHPGVYIKGLGRQSLRLPCFYFDTNYAILPAFGGFTGLATIKPRTGSRVFAIAEQDIISLQ